jgi:hypothetical protein
VAVAGGPQHLSAEERAGQTTNGAFDPVTDTGYLRSPYADGAAYYAERLIDGVRYVGSSGSPGFKQYPGKYDGLDYDRLLGASADPAQLLADLGERGTVTRTAADTYHFEVTLSNVSASNSTVTGDVVVDWSSQRISRVSYEAPGVVVPGPVFVPRRTALPGPSPPAAARRRAAAPGPHRFRAGPTRVDSAG